MDDLEYFGELNTQVEESHDSKEIEAVSLLIDQLKRKKEDEISEFFKIKDEEYSRLILKEQQLNKSLNDKVTKDLCYSLIFYRYIISCEYMINEKKHNKKLNQYSNIESKEIHSPCCGRCLH